MADPRQLPPPDRRRLVGCLALLGSPVRGEVLAAAAGASRIVKARGLSWDAVIAPALPEPDRAPPPPCDSADRDSDDGDPFWRCGGWRGCAEAILAWRPDLLSDRERRFCDTMCGWHGRASEAQMRWLRDIARRVRL
jgi:hypothetical protein